MLRDSYNVELLRKMPAYHRAIYEFKEISRLNETELVLLFKAIDKTLDDWFVNTATESSINRLEKIAGLLPDSTLDLETRRYRLLTRMTEKLPYTDETLEQRLGALAGEDNYSIVRNYLEYRITVNTTVTSRGSFDEICEALVNMLPCNLILEVYNTLRESGNIPLFGWVALSVAMGHTITHDIKAKDNLSMDIRNVVVLTDTNSHIITHDIKVSNSSQVPVFAGTGVNTADGKQITHDAVFRNNVSGNSNVANPVTTATLVTIN